MPKRAGSLKHRVDRLRLELEKINGHVENLYELGINREGVIVLLQSQVRLSKGNIERILYALEHGLKERYFTPVKEGEELLTAATVSYLDEVGNRND